MRTLLLALAAVLGADGGSPFPSGRPAAYAEARRAFARAIDTGALDEAREALRRRASAAPGRRTASCSPGWSASGSRPTDAG
ncbi:MAG TPA: hypothetical protein VFE93_02330 [Myxococcaceae bacterium]|nr:hypothetical protein [Myxococcaceae bacterium]